MPRFQLDKLNKNLRDLTVLKKLNNQGYSLKLKHVSSISRKLSAKEVEDLLRRRFFYTKGKPLIKVLTKDLNKIRKRLGL